MNDSEKKIKIAFVLWSLKDMGGSERVVYDLIRKLNKTLYSVLLISFEEGPGRELYEKIGVKIVVISKKKKIDFEFIYTLEGILTDEEVDIVNPHHFGPFFYTFVSTRRITTKLVYTEHSRWQIKQLNTIQRILNRIMLWRSDSIIAISKQIQDYYLHILKIRSNKVQLIPNGIDIPLFRNKKSSHLRESLGIGCHEKVIGMVANLRPEKNHKLLISAFSNVVKKINDIRLILVGADFMEGEIQKFADHINLSGKILFLGKRDDIPELLSIFDIFCLPSVYEGLPLTILEAMAAGLPIIGADVLGINEVLIDNLNGLLFPSNDEMKLSNALIMLLEDSSLRGRLSSAGESYVAQHYSLDEKVKEYEELFQSIYRNKTITAR